MTGVDPWAAYLKPAAPGPMASLPPPGADPQQPAEPAADPWAIYLKPPAPTWAETGKQAVKNLPSSALEFGKAMVQPILHPVDTAESLGKLGAGIIQKIRNLSPEHLRGSEPAFDEAQADAVGKHFTDRYGSAEGIQKAIGSDPVGVAADLSAVLTGGGTMAAKLPGIAGKAGSAVATVGKYTDPVNAATAPLKAVEPIVSNVLGMTTGAGAAPLREAAKAGMEGGDRQAALIGQMRRKEPISAVVETARDAINEMRTQRGDAYRSGMAGVTKDPALLDFAPVAAAVQKVADVGVFDGKIINRSAAPVWEKIRSVVEDWHKADPAINHTVEGFDALKKSIGDIRDSTQFGTPERRVADEVYSAVRQQIVKQAPAYGDVMKGYEEASDALRELEKSLSLGDKASIDTTVRKLQSVMRNNANTNYGQRVQQAQGLVDAGASTLMPQIAGQALSSPTPRGMAGPAATLGGVGSMLTNPAFLLGLPAASPRIMGEAALKAGQFARYPAKLAPMATALLGQPARTLMFNAGRMPGEGP